MEANAFALEEAAMTTCANLWERWLSQRWPATAVPSAAGRSVLHNAQRLSQPSGCSEYFNKHLWIRLHKGSGACPWT